MRRCVIVGGADIGQYDRIRAYLREDDFYICCDSGLKHREIADLLELPVSTVLSKYHRGLKKLKALMKGEDHP